MGAKSMQKSFPALERELEALVLEYITEVGTRHSPLMSEVSSHKLFEGGKSTILRETGESENTEIRGFSATLDVPKTTILYGSFDELFDLFTPIGKQIVADKEKLMFETINAATEKTGNIVSGEGKPLTIEKIMMMLETIQIDFDQSGNAIMPSLYGGGGLIQQYERLLQDSETPQNQTAFNDLIRRKKAEWLAREADRTLVG